MLFDKEAIRNELLRAKDNLVFDIKEHGAKVIDTHNVDVLEDMHDIEASALLEALTNVGTKHQALRKHLWMIVADDANESAGEDLLDMINKIAKEMKEEP